MGDSNKTRDVKGINDVDAVEYDKVTTIS